jgi:hypothetical protein
LIQVAIKLYASDSFTVELVQTAYALDTTTIDLRGNIPAFIHITDGKMHEVNVLDILIPETDRLYIVDHGFTDFTHWRALHQAQAFFVIRGKFNLLFRRVHSRAVDKSTELRCDQAIILPPLKAGKDYPQHLRRIKFYDAEHDRHLVFLTNNFDLPALAIAKLYRCRW